MRSSISKTQSVGTIPRRDKSALRSKKLLDDGFQIVYNLNCEAAGLQKYPLIATVAAEPVSWVTQLSVLDRKRQSNVRVYQSYLSMTQVSPKRTNSTDALKVSIENSENTEIIAVYNDSEQESQIHMLIYKHFPMEDDVMGVLQKTFVKFSTLKVLRLEYCNLTPEQIKAVKLVLRQNENITDLSLDGNPIKRQNYYLLLKNTGLVSFSLKFCKIDDIGATRISNCLHFPDASTLIILDLSCNSIGDGGCESLANALRTNRSLTHLSLANNFIRDKGCIALMVVLQKFSLNHDEIYLRRKMNMDYLLRMKLAKTEEMKPPVLEVASVVRHTSSSRIERRKSSLPKPKKERTSILSTSSFRRLKHRSGPIEERSEFIIAVPKDPHPYMHECTFELNEVFCRGNYTLTYLNLGYNRIYCDSVYMIRDTLMYQWTNRPPDKCGLQKLLLHGNPILECSHFDMVADLLDQGSEKVSESITSPPAESKRSIRKVSSAS